MDRKYPFLEAWAKLEIKMSQQDDFIKKLLNCYDEKKIKIMLESVKDDDFIMIHNRDIFMSQKAHYFK